MSTPSYRYVFADLLTDTDIVALELEGVTFDRRLIQAGAFRGSIPVPNADIAAKVRKIAPSGPDEIGTGPGRTVVHIYRDGQIWGTYLIWSATPSGDEKGRVKVDLQGASLESYLSRVEIRQDLTYTGKDQISELAADLVAQMQAQPYGDIGLLIHCPPCGILRDRTYKASEAATYGQRLTELANVEQGFEFMIRTYLQDGVRVRDFIGGLFVFATGQDQVWTRPGNILSWSYVVDATGAATSYQARGATINDDLGATSEPLMGAAADADALHNAGWARLDKTIDYSSVVVPGTLNDYARWWAANRAGVTRVLQATVRIDDQTAFTPNNLGDHARLTIVDAWFPLTDTGKPTFAKRPRIVGCEVTPPTRTTGETLKLILEEEAA